MSIVIKSISYSINNCKILQDISIKLMPGELLTVLGPNGSGKSTLLKIISGDIIPTDGEILIDSEHLKNISIEKRALKRSVMSQNQQIMYDFSVKEIIEMGWLYSKETEKTLNFSDILKQISIECEISHLLDRQNWNLSA